MEYGDLCGPNARRRFIRVLRSKRLTMTITAMIKMIIMILMMILVMITMMMNILRWKQIEKDFRLLIFVYFFPQIIANNSPAV